MLQYIISCEESEKLHMYNIYKGDYTKLDSSKKYMLWIFFTVGTSLIPIAIRIILMLYTDQKLVLEDFRVELFFLTIIFFVDAIKNFRSGAWMEYFTLFLLIITSTLYSLVMAENLKLLNVALSKFADISTVFFGIGSFLIDVSSLITGDE